MEGSFPPFRREAAALVLIFPNHSLPIYHSDVLGLNGEWYAREVVKRRMPERKVCRIELHLQLSHHYLLQHTLTIITVLRKTQIAWIK